MFATCTIGGLGGGDRAAGCSLSAARESKGGAASFSFAQIGEPSRRLITVRVSERPSENVPAQLVIDERLDRVGALECGP